MSVSIRPEPRDLPSKADNALIARLLNTIDRLDPEKLGALWDAQSDSEMSLEQSVMRAGLADERQIVEAYAKHYLLPLFDLPADQPPPIDPAVAHLIPAALCRDHLIAPLADDGHTLDVAIFAPTALRLADRLKQLTGRQMRPLFATQSVILRLLGALYAGDSGMEETCPDFEEIAGPGRLRLKEPKHDAAPLHLTASTDQVKNHVNKIFEQALRAGASDVHIESYGDRCRLRLRIGGLLAEAASPPVSLLPAIVAHLKELARLDAADRRAPQDGVLRLSGSGGRFDVRISTCPTVQGEKVVMRLRPQLSGRYDLRRLALEDRQRGHLFDALRSPHALVLVTGPADSEKSATLYACLNFINNAYRNLCSVEDPVECRLPGINQLQTRPSVGLTFPGALRTVLRQDPDAVMISELRDAETAGLAWHAAESGRLVLSALPTADVPASIALLQQWGCDLAALDGLPRLLVGQRLIRRLCIACRQAYQVDPAKAKQHGIPEDVTLYRPSGCERCSRTGYHGQLTLFEVVPVTGAVEQWLRDGASPERWQRAAAEAGVKRLRQTVRERLLDGSTSLEEAIGAAASARRPSRYST